MSKPKQILLVHGRGPKPTADQTMALWAQALQTGISRDYPALTPKFEAVSMDLFYYADKLASFHPPEYNSEQDLEDRLEALNLLQQLKKTADFRRRTYDQLPGKTALKEFVMDAGASLGLGGLLEQRLLPELAEYRAGKAAWIRQEQDRLTQTLARYVDSGTDLLIVSHCLGSVLVYDALWSLSHNIGFNTPAINLITLGSPLGSQTIQKNLNGSSAPRHQRFPTNLLKWNNIAAEDDYVSHDKTVADDYRDMLQDEHIEAIHDHVIYNPTLRFGLSNPHSSLGYLIHPKTAKLIGDWLAVDPKPAD